MNWAVACPTQGHRLCFWVSISVSCLGDMWGHSLPSAPPASPWRAPAAGVQQSVPRVRSMRPRVDAESVLCSQCSLLPGDAAGFMHFDQKNNKTQKVFKAGITEVHPGLGIPASRVCLDCLLVLLVKSVSFTGGS